jgi:N-methylhydantoinase B/oxoprolinase/acetone carboxylase alpha subunit
MLSPTVPANEGTYRPIVVRAPEGSILNAIKPASVRDRTHTGWHLHTLLFRALHAILPDRVQAGNGLLDVLHFYGQEHDGRYFNAHFFLAGGRGASRGRDGIGRNSFPSSARNVPVEVLETQVPVVVHARALRPNSAGAGQWRGAFGHRLEIGVLPSHPWPVSVFIAPDRMRYPPPGLAGGEDSPLKKFRLNGRDLSLDDLSEGYIALASPSDRLEVSHPGGAGYGPPGERDAALVRDDEESGLIGTDEATRPGATP